MFSSVCQWIPCFQYSPTLQHDITLWCALIDGWIHWISHEYSAVSYFSCTFSRSTISHEYSAGLLISHEYSIGQFSWIFNRSISHKYLVGLLFPHEYSAGLLFLMNIQQVSCFSWIFHRSPIFHDYSTGSTKFYFLFQLQPVQTYQMVSMLEQAESQYLKQRVISIWRDRRNVIRHPHSLKTAAFVWNLPALLFCR